jgi:hypothetical protein
MSHGDVGINYMRCMIFIFTDIGVCNQKSLETAALVGPKNTLWAHSCLSGISCQHRQLALLGSLLHNNGTRGPAVETVVQKWKRGHCWNTMMCNTTSDHVTARMMRCNNGLRSHDCKNDLRHHYLKVTLVKE